FRTSQRKPQITCSRRSESGTATVRSCESSSARSPAGGERGGAMNSARDLTSHVRSELSRVVVGQEEVLDQLLLVLLAGGHALIEGVPGLAKTLSVKTLAQIFQVQFRRVQCTPDLMPADVVGANVFNQATSAFSLHRGPVFTDLLLVD